MPDSNSNQQYPATQISRDFKGIWIPREVWLAEGLSPTEKILWAEIHSLYDRERGGCYASNEYLMRFMGVKERRLQEMIANLKAYGLVEQVSFDGRERIIKAILPKEGFIACRAEVQKSAPLGCEKVHPTGAESCTPPIYIDSKDEGIDNIPPNPQGGKPPIGGGGGSSSSSSKKSKKDKIPEAPKDAYLENIFLTKDEYSKLLALHGEKSMLWMMEVLSAYIGSNGKQYKSHYHLMNKGGWVCKRLEEEKIKNPNLQPKGNYQRYGKLAIEADKRAEPTQRQQFTTNVSDDELNAFLAKKKNQEGKTE